MDSKLGKVTRVDLREIWKNEEYDFSNWLAGEENLIQFRTGDRDSTRHEEPVWSATVVNRQMTLRRYSWCYGDISTTIAMSAQIVVGAAAGIAGYDQKA